MIGSASASKIFFNPSLGGIWDVVYIFVFLIFVLAVLGIIFGIIAKAKRNAEAKKKYASKKTETDNKEEKDEKEEEEEKEDEAQK